MVVCFVLEDIWLFALTYSPTCGNSQSKTLRFVAVRALSAHGMSSKKNPSIVQWHPFWCHVQLLRAVKGYFLACLSAVGRCNRRMDSFCQYEWIQHLDLMPSSASWKKDSSGSPIYLRRMAEFRGLGRICFTFSPSYLGTPLTLLVLFGAWLFCCVFS